jgi:hypothetical protein
VDALFAPSARAPGAPVPSLGASGVLRLGARLSGIGIASERSPAATPAGFADGGGDAQHARPERATR